MFSRGQTDTEQINRASKQLPMPSEDLSNFSPGGRTGYAKQLGVLQAPWEEKSSLKPGLFSVCMENLLFFTALCAPEP